MNPIRLLLIATLLSSYLLASIGKISAMNGEVSVLRASKTIKASSGFLLEEKDNVKSAKGSTAQLVFNDNTVITVGSNTTFSVEEYSSDESSPKARFGVAEGSFKAITGKIGKLAPEKFKLETRTATIGIRGTAFTGNVGSDGDLRVACTKGAIVLTHNGRFVTPPPPVVIPAGQMSGANKKGIEAPRIFTPKDLKEIGRGLGEYAKRDSGKEPNIESEVKTTAAAKDAKDKVSDTVGKVIEQVNSGATTPSWAAAYTSDYVSGVTYNANGYYSSINYSISTGNIYSWGQNGPLAVAILNMENNTIYSSLRPSGAISQSTVSIQGEDSFSATQSGTYYGSPTTFTIFTKADPAGLDYVSWGYWSRTIVSSDQNTIGVWVAGIPTINMPASGSASYKGSVIGNVVTSGASVAILENANNSATFNVNFGSTNAITGNITFQAGSQTWNANLSGSSSGNRFSITPTGNMQTGGDTYALSGSSTKGAFYGPQAAVVGGSFMLSTTPSDAAGVFKATKQ